MCYFFFNDTEATEIYSLSLHDALPIFHRGGPDGRGDPRGERGGRADAADAGAHSPGAAGERAGDRGLSRSEEHTSELQSRSDLVCRLLLEKKKQIHLYSSPATSTLTMS